MFGRGLIYHRSDYARRRRSRGFLADHQPSDRGSIGSRRLPFNLESRTLDQLAGTVKGASVGGELAVDEDRVDGVEDFALPLAKIKLPAAGGANLTARIEQAEQACGLEASVGS